MEIPGLPNNITGNLKQNNIVRSYLQILLTLTFLQRKVMLLFTHVSKQEIVGTQHTSYMDTLSKQWRQQSTLEVLVHSAKNSHGHHMWTIQLPKHLRNLDSSGETCFTAQTESEKRHTMLSSYLSSTMQLQLGTHT